MRETGLPLFVGIVNKPVQLKIRVYHFIHIIRLLSCIGLSPCKTAVFISHSVVCVDVWVLSLWQPIIRKGFQFIGSHQRTLGHLQRLRRVVPSAADGTGQNRAISERF